ncbi:MAG TPA: GNAT family N-acetyltransferase [Vicinamibacterales bacterium]|nr:GNAT family N-acetyltransferase [Vicinamibacterales bacterium]
MTTIVLQTPRLALRHLHDGDAGFILELLNDPGWLRFIGNKSVHDHEGAINYIAKAQRMYREKGFGLWVVERRADGEKLGLCGLIKRDTLHDVDLGFGLLTRYHGQGYGNEAGAGVLEYGRKVVGLARIVAITSPDNVASSSLLEKLGFVFERVMQLVPGDDVKLYSAG